MEVKGLKFKKKKKKIKVTRLKLEGVICNSPNFFQNKLKVP